MTLKRLNGDQALAYGALDSGIKLVTSYPGSPSSGTVETLIELAKKQKFYVEWSANEKVAVEMGIGASIAGCRVLVCTKSVGMNVMIDPLMVLNLTPLNGGLVILLGDDPGGYGSQNDQDSRPLASFLEIPMMEPASPAEGYAMVQEAFHISEKFSTAVIIRVTRSFTQQVGEVQTSDEPFHEFKLGLVREPWRFVPVPKNAVEKHRALHERIDGMDDWTNSTPFNMTEGKGQKGVIGAGFAHSKLLDVVGVEPTGEFRLFKLGVIYPPPRKIIAEFLKDCQEVLIIEESEPYLETQIKAIAHDTGCLTKVYGKQSHHLSPEGELFRWQIQQALLEFIPDFIPRRQYLEEKEAEERPKKKDYCADCQYDKILDKLDEAAESLGQRPVLVGDPGCLVTVADRLDAKYALGSAVGIADGLNKAGVKERAVALLGDSSFFHSTLPAVCNAVHNRSNILMVVLDNKATATSGHQANPGVARDALGQDAPALDIERIVRACGVKKIFGAGPNDLDTTLKETSREALSHDELTLMIIRTE